MLTLNRPCDFCQGRLQSACQWVAVVHSSSVLGLKMCCGASGTSRLTGGEDTQAHWFSKLISIKYGPAVVSQFKTHATVKQDSSHLQVAGGKPDGGWGSLDRRCHGKGELLPKNLPVRQRGASDILSPLQLMAKVLLSSKGSGFHPPCASC